MAGLLSILFPGIGQVFNRQQLKGGILIIIELAIIYVTVPSLLMVIIYRSLWIYAVADAVVIAQLIRKKKKSIELRRGARDFLPVILTVVIVLPLGWTPAFTPQIIHFLAHKAQESDIPKGQLEKDTQAYEVYLADKYDIDYTFGDGEYSEMNGHFTLKAASRTKNGMTFSVSKDRNGQISDTYMDQLWSHEVSEELSPLITQLYDDIWVFETDVAVGQATEADILTTYDEIPDFQDVKAAYPGGYHLWITLYVFNDFRNKNDELEKMYELFNFMQNTGITFTGVEIKYYDEALYENEGRDINPTNEYRSYASHFITLNQKQITGIQSPDDIAEHLIKLEKFYRKQ